MSTNFIDDRLCNNNFDCDNCCFDKEMRNLRHQKELRDNIYHFSDRNIIDEVIDKIESLKHFTYPRHYFFCTCFIIKKFLGDSYFLGLNPMVSLLLDNITGFKVCNPEQPFKKGDKFINVSGDWGLMDILAPFDLKMESEVLPVSSKSERNKWIGFIKSGKNNFDCAKTGKEEFFKSVEKICNYLKSFNKKHTTVGITMYDGGEKLKYIYQVIGKENYIKILKQILS